MLPYLVTQNAYTIRLITLNNYGNSITMNYLHTVDTMGCANLVVYLTVQCTYIASCDNTLYSNTVATYIATVCSYL